MDANILNALRARVGVLPGGRDKDERPLVLVNVPLEIHPCYKNQLVTTLKYLLNCFSSTSLRNGLTVIVNAVDSGWRVTRSCLRQIIETLSKDLLASLLVLRLDAFWDKQRVENCTKSQKDGPAIYIPRSRLVKFVDFSQLPNELGGSYVYNHEKWIHIRQKVEEFVSDAKYAMDELDDLRNRLLNNCSLRANDIDNAVNTSVDLSESTKMLAQTVIDAGRELLLQIEQENRNRKFDSEGDSMSTPQDILDTIENIECLLKDIDKKQTLIDKSWIEMQKSFREAKELYSLEEGVSRVTNWILTTGEAMSNHQQHVGFDVASAEELRIEHEMLEFKCWETYGQYAELLYKIDKFSIAPDSIPHRDLISQRDFMDFVCRSFATRLEKRRNLLITSLRFFRLVSEYFDRTSEVFESLVMGQKIDEFEGADWNLRKLHESQQNLDAIELELVKEGEKLSDMLSIPVKDALGSEVPVNYEEEIVNIRDILDATTARKNIFTDSVELQKLTLEKITHIVAYEKDALQAVQWLNDLFKVMTKSHSQVGCNVYEIQLQKDELQAFQETVKGTYNYGCQLLNASLILRQSCKIPTDNNTSLSLTLRHSWQRLQDVCQEQMTRLRVSAVFHRSVDEYCLEIQDLRDAVSGMPQEDITKKRARVRKFFVNRERLLMEVGRMVRLGRLLRTRLKEQLFLNEMSDGLEEKGTHSVTLNEDNATAIESISDRLSEVTGLAEQLDMALRGAQQDCALVVSPATPVTPSIKKIFDGTASATPEEWYTNNPPLKPPRIEDGKSDDEFLTASEYTAQSRSSSFHTASECGALSPWWELDRSSDREDFQKEKLVLAVGLPELPNPNTVLKPRPEVPPGKIVSEVTETTHLKVQHSHTLGVSSFVLTSETVKDRKGVPLDTASAYHTVLSTAEDRAEAVPEGKEMLIPVFVEKNEADDDLLRKMREVSAEPSVLCEDNAWGKYYHQYITQQTIKGCM